MQNEKILNRDILYKKIVDLREKKKEIENALFILDKELLEICPCNETEGYGYNICKHCQEIY